MDLSDIQKEQQFSSFSFSAYPAKTRYHGDTAAHYNIRREKNPKWRREFAALRNILSACRSDSSILDIPVGTGRFIPLYNSGFRKVFGFDVSLDMVRQAIAGYPAGKVYFGVGEAEKIPFCDKSIDYLVSIRFLNWISTEHLRHILQEYTRVARLGIIVSIRVEEASKGISVLFWSIYNLIPAVVHGIFQFRKTLSRFKSRLRKMKSAEVSWASQENTKISNGYAVHKGADILDIFSALQLTIERVIDVDVPFSYRTRTIKPYRFYFLKFSDGKNCSSLT